MNGQDKARARKLGAHRPGLPTSRGAGYNVNARGSGTSSARSLAFHQPTIPNVAVTSRADPNKGALPGIPFTRGASIPSPYLQR